MHFENVVANQLDVTVLKNTNVAEPVHSVNLKVYFPWVQCTQLDFLLKQPISRNNQPFLLKRNFVVLEQGPISAEHQIH